ncbi:hypothetical protein GSbR_07540 [Geobacter sp. SVR]|nr:secondary thiamine-phosphate synthase enzyme YjbQ [Geobacter sp. SVR]BCS53649.1 hypothetical protein GSVR_19570 [Geobacter sp. SVR]GCF84154.1 hypothetical protein GSbR_07540 [Geobacter sp. SVR]
MQTAEFNLETQRRTHFAAIAPQVAAILEKQGWRDGVLTIFSPHTTAAITINENADPDVARDMERFSDELIPQSRHFRHARVILMPISRPASTALRFR